ncbi:MAG: hypothetical protein KC635_21970, partial [Myxococcales bacterium]|nr:hypothetical protein [Myxococcales bacterium]
GCASGPTFKDEPVVWRVADDRPIAEPEENPWHPYLYFADLLLFDAIADPLSLPDAEPAGDVNALDEVPDSTWFANRVGVRQVTPEEAARGPVTIGPPALPLVITAGKSAGGNPGFFAKDARGERFLVKFDTVGNPEMQTSVSVIVNRIFWTAGYHVPEDTIFVFGRGDVALADDATIEEDTGDERAMTAADLDEVLALAPRRADGRWRASASRFLAGVPKGGWEATGTRDDDPNDRVPHEHRRVLRGLRVLSAWVSHVDMKEDNTLDMYVGGDDAGRGGHLVHYLVDFGEAMGAHQAEKDRREDGFEHVWDWGAQARAFVSFGLWVRPWERQRRTPWRSVGYFAGEPFEPAAWKEAYPYEPFRRMTPADAYWGAKLVMRFDRPLLEAIVAEGQLSDAAAARWVVDALLARRVAIGKAFLEGLTAFDDVHVAEGRLCGVDLGVLYGLESDGALERVDAEGNVLETAVSERGTGAVCVGEVAPEGYAQVTLRMRRGRTLRPPMIVHLHNGHVVGIIRDAR